MTQHTKWIELWIDSPSRGDYFLVLRELIDGSLEIIDPQKNGEVVNTFVNYEDAVHWLDEDEYDLVEGRWSPD